jgi:hypothetical protein
LENAVKQDLECVANSTGKVREFFVRTPCKSLDMVLYALGDGHGNAAIISVAWVGFRNKQDAAEFERIERVQDSGDVTPLGGVPLGLAHLRFTGHHYHARPDGATMVIGEADTASGHLYNATLSALAEVTTYHSIFAHE